MRQPAGEGGRARQPGQGRQDRGRRADRPPAEGPAAAGEGPEGEDGRAGEQAEDRTAALGDRQGGELEQDGVEQHPGPEHRRQAGAEGCAAPAGGGARALGQGGEGDEERHQQEGAEEDRIAQRRAHAVVPGRPLDRIAPEMLCDGVEGGRQTGEHGHENESPELRRTPQVRQDGAEDHHVGEPGPGPLGARVGSSPAQLRGHGEDRRGDQTSGEEDGGRQDPPPPGAGRRRRAAGSGRRREEPAAGGGLDQPGTGRRQRQGLDRGRLVRIEGAVTVGVDEQRRGGQRRQPGGLDQPLAPALGPGRGGRGRARGLPQLWGTGPSGQRT